MARHKNNRNGPPLTLSSFFCSCFILATTEAATVPFSYSHSPKIWKSLNSAWQPIGSVALHQNCAHTTLRAMRFPKENFFLGNTLARASSKLFNAASIFSWRSTTMCGGVTYWKGRLMMTTETQALNELELLGNHTLAKTARRRPEFRPLRQANLLVNTTPSSKQRIKDIHTMHFSFENDQY